MEMRKGSLLSVLFWLMLGFLLIWGKQIEGHREEEVQFNNGNKTSRSRKVNLIHVGAVVDEVSPSIGVAAQKCIKMALTDFYAFHPNYNNKLVLHFRDSHDMVAATSAGELKQKLYIYIYIYPSLFPSFIFCLVIPNCACLIMHAHEL
ncbi:hypothetical protein IC575_004579 [Cucumis melo]